MRNKTVLVRDTLQLKHFKENRLRNGFEGKVNCDLIQNNLKVELNEERSDEKLISKTYDVEKHSMLTYIFLVMKLKKQSEKNN